MHAQCNRLHEKLNLHEKEIILEISSERRIRSKKVVIAIISILSSKKPEFKNFQPSKFHRILVEFHSNNGISDRKMLLNSTLVG